MSRKPIQQATTPVIENLESRRMLSATLSNGQLIVGGTRHSDDIVVYKSGRRSGFVYVNVDGQVSRFASSKVRGVRISGGRGADDIVLGATLATSRGNVVSGGDDNDTIQGGAGNETLNGDAGDDSINGGAGDDDIEGGLGDDSCNGGAGDDHIDGNGGIDHERGGTGHDTLVGGRQDDAVGDNDDSVLHDANEDLGGDDHGVHSGSHD